MKIMVVDDEPIALEELSYLLHDFADFQEIVLFNSSQKALDWLQENKPDIAFLDINMKGMNGLSLAKNIKEQAHDCAIVFVTGYSEYALQAIQMHAAGYLMKPVQKQDIQQQLAYIMNMPAPKIGTHRIGARCFGNFEVYADKVPMHFQYAKTKELFAYLVDRAGARCTNGEMIAIMWEDDGEQKRRSSHFRNLKADLLTALKKVNSADIIRQERGTLALVPKQIDCDYFDWLKGEIYAINAYRGEYLTQYSWGEFTLGEIEKTQKF